MRVGLDAGLIGPELFTMLLVMAILTTVMTGPLLTLFAGRAAPYGRSGNDVAPVEPKPTPGAI